MMRMRSLPPQRGGMADPIGSLLILTDGRSTGQQSLALPFRRATIRDINDLDQVQGTFDAAAIDIDQFDIRRIARVIGQLRAWLRVDSRIYVMLVTRGTWAPDRDDGPPPDVTGVTWLGIGTAGTATCAMLRVDDQAARSPSPLMALEAAHTATRLQSDRTAQAAEMAQRVQSELVAALEARRSSEVSLIQHVGALTRETERLRLQYRGVSLVGTILSRSRAGRALLRAGRPAWRRIYRPSSS